MDIEETFISTGPMIQKISFGLGHIFNDLCAAIWFSYMLFYLHVVVNLPSTTAGTLLMLGQLIDAIATPAAGWAIDFSGHKRIWHFGGTVAVTSGFALIFSYKPVDYSTAELVQYIFAITLFQIGWAVVQIAHLSIIPDISRNHNHSSDLTAIRYTASVCCSITVYIVTLILLQTGENTKIGPDDFHKFKEIALVIVCIGVISSLFFYCGLLGSCENDYEIIREVYRDGNLRSDNRNQHFLRQSTIYLVALMYMASRLFTTLNLIYIPLYLDERGKAMNREEQIRQTIATIPLVCYISSLLTSLFLKFRCSFCTDKLVYLTGGVVGLMASVCLGVKFSSDSDVELYFIAILLGISGSSTMVASLCFTANFVKSNGYGGGSVYSVVTFTDKLFSGAAVLLVQHLQCIPKNLCPNYYAHVLTYICGIVSILGLISLLVLEVQLRKSEKRRLQI